MTYIYVVTGKNKESGQRIPLFNLNVPTIPVNLFRQHETAIANFTDIQTEKYKISYRQKGVTLGYKIGPEETKEEESK